MEASPQIIHVSFSFIFHSKPSIGVTPCLETAVEHKLSVCGPGCSVCVCASLSDLGDAAWPRPSRDDLRHPGHPKAGEKKHLPQELVWFLCPGNGNHITQLNRGYFISNRYLVW